jgi:2,3-bisphosphoglycerate-independent phosphoglycerate mutase
MNKQVALIVLDGWGYREEKENNAIAQAHKPFFDSLWNKYPHTTLKASGEAVGLPEGQMGNSEVGHMTIGAGKAIDQDLIRINKSITGGEFKENEVFKNLFIHLKKHDSVLHVAGLISPGGVHSHMNHLFEFLKIAKENQIKKIALHLFTDGRDTAPQAGATYIKDLENLLTELNLGEIISVSGRLYAMDRDQRWERLEKTTEAMFQKKGIFCKEKASAFLEKLYSEGLSSDEYLEPFVCLNKDEELYTLKENDGFFFFNFRADRMRMLFKKISEQTQNQNVFLATMTSYGEAYKSSIVFPLIKTDITLGKIISDNNLKQVHIAETEKFAHATYFLNCGQEKPYKNEEQILIQSPKEVLTYDLAPKMSAEKVADTAIEQIQKGVDFIFVNFANADMVGHTANVPAIIVAIEEVDKQLKRIIEVLEKINSCALITADHGNAEINFDLKSNSKHTSHTSSLVPLILTQADLILKEEGTLADIAPTVLKILNIEKPSEMSGESLITNN